MQRLLVVANLTLGGDHLLDILRQRVSEGPCHIHVLVPASHTPDHWAFTMDDGRAAARERLSAALERFGELGVDVDGEVGDERPPDAIRDVLRRQEFDEVVLSTLPPGVSKWLGLDLVSRVERMVDVPVTHVIGRYEPVEAT